MPTVLDWNPTVDPSEVMGPLRDALAAGELVVLPGDVGYVVLVNPAAAATPERLGRLPADGPPAVLAFGPDDPALFGLGVPLAARRLMFRAWPAPLAVALPAAGASFPADWPGAVREAVAAGGAVRFRYPDHPLFDAVWPSLPGPTLVLDTFHPTATAAVDALGGAAGLVIAAGEIPAGDRPTEVLATPAGWELTRPGAYAADELHKLAARIILFVCTGNTCRSPLAEGLAKTLLADRLGCAVGDLPARGFWVVSAGVAAYGGGPVSPESELVGAEFGADLRDHRSRPVNPPLLAAADDVIAMTRAHADVLEARYPGVGPPARLLCGDDTDLDDPIGAGMDVYRECARTILDRLQRFLPEWVGP